MRLLIALFLPVFLIAISFNLPQSKTIVVPVDGDLQAAINSAQPGDTIVIPAGATFTGNFVIPVKSGSAYITIRSSRCDELPAGIRVDPSKSPLLATIATPNVAPVLYAPINSSYFRFQCVQFTQGAQLPVDTVAGYAWSYNLIQLGDGGAGEQQTTLASVPHHFELDRVVVRPREGAMTQRGMTLNSASTSITNSWIADIKWPGVETQAVGGWNGPGPFVIENNYLEAAGINVLFGGAPHAIPDLVPSDITIRRNTITKRLEWKDKGYAVKNLLELKNARRVTFTDNVCRNSWPDAQTGWAVILNAFRDGPNNLVDDVEISRNTFTDVSNGINLRGMEGDDAITRMHRISIHDNLIENLGAFNGEGKAFQLLNGTENVTIEHNTVRGRVNNVLILDSLATVKHAGLRFISNLMPHGEYGIFGAGGLFGTAALNAHASNWTATANALYAKPQDPAASLYPSGNYFPATEAESVALSGTDGLPVGMRGLINIPTPTPTPSVIPTPTPTPTPSPSPSPTVTPTPSPTPLTTCTMTISSPILPQWGTGKLVVTFTGLTQSGTVKATSTSGQVAVDGTPKPVSGTSMIVELWLQAKKKSSDVVVSGPCGVKTVMINVR